MKFRQAQVSDFGRLNSSFLGLNNSLDFYPLLLHHFFRIKKNNASSFCQFLSIIKPALRLNAKFLTIYLIFAFYL